MAKTKQSQQGSSKGQGQGAQVAEPSSSPRRNTVSAQQIAVRAYEIFVARGGEHGSDVQDWLQAERELGLGKQ